MTAAPAALAALVAERAVRACLGASAASAVPAAVAARGRPVAPPPTALPIWLLVAGHAVDAAAGRRALGAALAELLAAGLVVERAGQLHATAAVAALGAGVIVADRLDAAADPTDADRVPWPDDSSLHLLGCLPAGRLGRWLDVGTGAAVAPLGAGPRAARVRGTDVNPRALARAAQGARLSGRADLELAPADLLDGAGPGWDLITFNAPLPADAPRAPATTWHRAARAGLIERFWTEVAAHLAPGGEVLAHTAVDAAPWLAHGDRPGAWTIARYTPAGEPGFAITRWRPDAAPARALVEIVLDRGRPYLTRRDLA